MTTLNKSLVGTGLGTGLAVLTANKLYSDYKTELEYKRRRVLSEYNKAFSQWANKTAGVVDSAKALFLKQYPEFGKNSVDIQKGPETTTISFNGPHNIGGEVLHAVKTIKNDPGNHKKKALAGTAAILGGLALTSRYYTDAVKNAVKDKTAPINGDGAQTLISRIAGAVTPAALYYILQNRDRPERAGLGAGVAAASIREANKARKQIDASVTGIDPKLRNDLLKANGSIGLTALSGLYTLHQFQAAADEERLAEIAASKDLSDVEKAKEINRIRSRKDFLTRYPAFRAAPYSERLRGWYNKFHKPEPVVSPEDYTRVFKTKVETD